MPNISKKWIREISKNNPEFEIGQPVMVKNHVHLIFKPKYLLDYRVLKILHNITLLLVTPNDKERKTNINVNPCSTLELIKMLGIHSWASSKSTLKIPHITSDLGLILSRQCVHPCCKYILSDCLRHTSSNNTPHCTDNYQS